MSGIINPPSGTLPHNHDASDIVSGQLVANRLPAYQNATAFVKDDAVIDSWLFANGQVQCFANSSGIPAIGLHSGGKEAISIYYLDGQLRTRRNTNVDYRIAEVETGIWTPALFGSASAGTNSYSIRQGRWRRIANQIFADFNLALNSSSGMSGNLMISAPSVAINDAGAPFSGCLSKAQGLNLLSGQTAAIAISPNSSNIAVVYFHNNSANGSVNAATVSAGLAISGSIAYSI